MGKLNKLLKTWPNGTVGTQLWLEQQEIYRQLSKKYVNNGWLEKIGHGAFIKAGDKVNWLGGVFALQTGLKLPVHIGGYSALELLGRVHFITKSIHPYIYAHAYNADRSLPSWFTNGFTGDPKYIRQNLFINKIGLQFFDCTTFVVQISCPERAIFEMLALVPNEVTYEHAFLLMQGQELLRVEMLQELLESCTSYVLKRLFLHLAKKCQLNFIKRLDLQDIELGSGKRIIGKNATTYDPEFKLMLPNLPDYDNQDIVV